MKTAREAALLALYEIEYNGAYSNIALKNILKAAQADPRDSAFAAALTYGVISQKLMLDYMIEQLSKVRLKKLSKYILLILRMGLFQLKFMDKIPQNAAVNESVKLARRYGHSASAGYVNGVLRTAARTDFAAPSDMYVKYSFAKEVADRLYKDYGARAGQIMEYLNREPRMTIRVNRLKTGRGELAERLSADICPLVPDALYAKRLDASKSREFEQGFFTVQDVSPMAACLALEAKAGDFVIDVCAAPGGKTTYIAELMQNRGKITAFDLHNHRVELIKKNAARLGIDIIDASAWDAACVKTELIGCADRVIADVPCSGLGIARRKPELKYKTDFAGLPELQYKILSAAAEYLKKGGTLVYSTCTLYKEENEGVVERFLSGHKEFVLDALNLPDGFCRDGEGMLTVLPDKIDADGFFMAKLKRI